MFSNGHWIGKIIGFAVGLAKGGIAGAFFGLFLGHLFDSWRAGLSAVGNIQAGFFKNLFATLGHLAKSDGTVSQNEINQAEDMIRRMRLSSQERVEAIAQFNRGKRSDYDFHQEIKVFAKMTITRPDLRQVFLEILVEAAAADGRLAIEELQILQYVSQQLRLPPRLLEDMLAWLRGGRQRPGPDYQSGSQPSQSSQDYLILGIDKNASDAQVKRAYRKLMSKHHPDKLIHQGLPESAMDIAREKARDINAAYDRVKSRRGFK